MEEKTKIEEQDFQEKLENQEKTAAEEAQEKDLQQEAEKLMEKEGLGKIYRAGDYWFASQDSAKAYSEAVGGEIKIFEKK